MNFKFYLKEICKNCARVLKDIPDRLFFKEIGNCETHSHIA